MTVGKTVDELPPTSWSYDPPKEAPIRAHCAGCGKSAVVLRPRIADVANERYVIEGQCKNCGAPITFVL